MSTPITIALSATHLRASRGAEELHRRGLVRGEVDAVAAATERYAGGTADRTARLAIGSALLKWLDGPDGWLSGRLVVNPSDLWLEFVLDPDGDPHFLDAPWELLVAEFEFLADRDRLSFSVVRRYVDAVPPPKTTVYRPSVVFMAAATRDSATPLGFEAEERAILNAIGVDRVDFLCEDTGNLKALGEFIQLETEGDAGVDIVHLSCHGALLERPILVLENDYGDAEFVEAEQLAEHLCGIRPPRLLFVSACETAKPDRMLGSMAGDLARRGFPAVIGWAGSVRDVAATHFAADLYEWLAKQHSLEESVAHARQKLAAHAEPRVAAEWHLARVYFGASGGGPICAGRRRRHWHDANRAEQEYLDKGNQLVPVATRRQFVGRRRPIQTVLRLLRSGTPTVVQGLGQHGKSSMAARIASRFPSHAPVVVFGDYTAKSILGKIGAAVTQVGRETADLIRSIVAAHIDRVNDAPDDFQTALQELLDGPLQELQTTDDGKAKQRPILLIIDDFEQALDPPHVGDRVKPELAAGLAAVFRAFAKSGHKSHLLLTSRFVFTCEVDGRDAAEKLVFSPLDGMNADELQRQASQLATQTVEQMQQRSRSPMLPADAKRIEESLLGELVGVIPVVGGSPRLMSYAAKLRAENAAALAEFAKEAQKYSRDGTTTHQGLVDILNHIAIDKLLSFLDPNQRELLRRSCLFRIPAPVAVLEYLHPQHATAPETATAAAIRLFNLGLLNRFENPLNHRLGHDHALIDPLVRPKLDPEGPP